LLLREKLRLLDKFPLVEGQEVHIYTNEIFPLYKNLLSLYDPLDPYFISLSLQDKTSFYGACLGFWLNAATKRHKEGLPNCILAVSCFKFWMIDNQFQDVPAVAEDE